MAVDTELSKHRKGPRSAGRRPSSDVAGAGPYPKRQKRNDKYGFGG